MAQKLLTWSAQAPSLVWGFTESDFYTFVIPDTAFGVLGALAATPLWDGFRPSAWEILWRIPLVVLYNWSNLFSFDLANQRSPESIAEDRVNKPWRPLATGKITSEQTRRIMLVSIPMTLCLNHWLGVMEQGAMIHIITWLYNDLGGMDEAFIREMLISVGYAMFNMGSLKLALGDYARINGHGFLWTAIVSGVILTTMQIQDLKDQAGDRLRGRKTVVLFLGEGVSRGSIAFFVVLWTCVCAWFWTLSAWWTLLPGLPAGLIAWRVLTMREQKEDRRSWHLWCFWLVCLYVLPVLGGGAKQ